jgi:hypothetical protein
LSRAQALILKFLEVPGNNMPLNLNPEKGIVIGLRLQEEDRNACL